MFNITLNKKILLSCFLAGCLETYDFAVFGLLASTLHNQYFSFMNNSNSLIISYALFSVGFICRPIGAIIFGHVGDKYGRKLAIVLSVSFMGMSSLMLCLMPSYESIGVLSCYMIALARIIQGISMGGEFSGGVIYAIEHFDKKHSGFVGSFVVAGSALGILIATMIVAIIKEFIVFENAWRFAFLLGFGLSILGYFIRTKLTETPEFLLIKTSKSNLPLIDGLIKFRLELFTTIFVIGAGGTHLYCSVVFLPSFLGKVADTDLAYLPLLTTLCLLILSPVWGIVSDKGGRAKILMLAAIITSIYMLTVFPLIIINNTEIIILSIMVIHAVLLSIPNGVMNVFIVELFPAQYRYSCVGFGHSIGMGIIGGTSPIVAELVTNYSDNSIFNFSVYFAFVTLLSAISIGLIVLKRRKKVKNN